MQMTETLSYDADPATVFAMLCDEAWREQVCEAGQALDYSVRVERSGDQAVVTTKRTLPARVPDAVRRMTGDTITLTQVERWGPATADGSRTADLEVTVAGQPADMTGDILLSPAGAGTTETVTGDVRVRIPLIGRKVEPQMADAIRAGIRVEGDVGRTYLAS